MLGLHVKFGARVDHRPGVDFNPNSSDELALELVSVDKESHGLDRHRVSGTTCNRENGRVLDHFCVALGV